MNNTVLVAVGLSMFSRYGYNKVKYSYGEDYQPIRTNLENLGMANYFKAEPYKATEIYNDSNLKYDILHIVDCIRDFGMLDANGAINNDFCAEVNIILESVSSGKSVTLISDNTLLSVLSCELLTEFFKKHHGIDVLFQRPSSSFSKQSDSRFVCLDANELLKQYENPTVVVCWEQVQPSGILLLKEASAQNIPISMK